MCNKQGYKLANTEAQILNFTHPSYEVLKQPLYYALYVAAIRRWDRGKGASNTDMTFATGSL